MAERLHWGPAVMARDAHRGWLDAVSSLHTAGLAAALFPASLPARLGSAAHRPPEPFALTRLLEAYYRGDGDIEAGLSRLRSDRMVLHREGDRATARQIVARLRLAAPELGPLALIERSDDELVMRTQGAVEPVAAELLEVERFRIDGAAFERRTITVRALVAATNALLARRGRPERFVPLATCDAVEGWVALEPADALVLDAARLLAEPLDAIRVLACWNRGPLVVYKPSRQVA